MIYKTFTSETVSVFLSMFDVPAVARVCYPPAPQARPARTAGDEGSNPALTATALSGDLPPLDALIEAGRVLALNMPAGTNPALARAIGFSAAQLVEHGALPEHVRQEAERVLRTRRNILVSGGTGSGKTTLLNALIELLPDDERIVAMEDTLELRIDRPNCVRFEARGLQQGAVTIRDLLRHALRHRPSPRRRRSARRRGRRPVASPQHRPRRLAHHGSRQQRGERPLTTRQLRHAGRRRSPVGRDVPGRGRRDRHGDPHDPRRRAALRRRSRRGERLRRRDQHMGHTPTRPRDRLRPSRTHRRITAVRARSSPDTTHQEHHP